VVWRTEDGERWEAIPLETENLRIRRSLNLKVTIAAGPHGVMVVGHDNVHPPLHHGLFTWYAPDGRTFGAMAEVLSPVGPGPVSPAIAASPDGFLLGIMGEAETRLLSSRDGTQWQDIGRGLSPDVVIEHMSGNARATVMFTRRPDSEELVPWYRHDGEWRPATIDPGRLPDAGVVPADQRRVTAVRNWGTGFVAVGHTHGNDGQERSGLVWYSADGSAWTRMPVRANGFDAARPLMDLAVSRHTALLVGHRFDDDKEWLLMWQADAS
jgi:hypothetical protein